MSLEDLKGLIKDVVQKALGEVTNSGQEELLSPKRAAEFLGVAKGTLYSYEGRGLITKYYLGDLPRYRKSELMDAFIKVENRRAA